MHDRVEFRGVPGIRSYLGAVWTCLLWRSRLRYVCAVLTLMFTIAITISYCVTGEFFGLRRNVVFVVAVLPFTGIVLFVFVVSLLRLLQYALDYKLRKDLVCCVDSEGMTSTSLEIGDSLKLFMSWDMVTKMIETKRYWFIWYGPGRPMVLHKSQLSEQKIETLRKIVAETDIKDKQLLTSK